MMSTADNNKKEEDDIRLKVFMWTWRYTDREYAKKMLAYYEHRGEKPEQK